MVERKELLLNVRYLLNTWCSSVTDRLETSAVVKSLYFQYPIA